MAGHPVCLQKNGRFCQENPRLARCIGSGIQEAASSVPKTLFAGLWAGTEISLRSFQTSYILGLSTTQLDLIAETVHSDLGHVHYDETWEYGGWSFSWLSRLFQDHFPLMICWALFICCFASSKTSTRTCARSMRSISMLITVCLLNFFLFSISLISANYLTERRETVLESLCVTFEGVMLDAKHFKVHVYEKRVDQILNLNQPVDFSKDYEIYM